VELSREAVVQLRSEEARELARSWVVNGTRRAEPEAGAPAPLPGEGAALEHLLVDLPEPGATNGDEEATPTIVEPVERPAVDAGTARRTGRTREKVAVVALDVELLNARLRQQSSR
jgi:hypothetical protein